MKTKCYGYLRVSGQGQVDGDGFARQEAAIQKYAEEHDLEVVRFFWEEGVSGTIEHRPALAEMMVDLEQNGHGIRTVVVERVDRLARDLMVQESIIKDFQKHGFQLISALEGDGILSDDPTRKLIRQVLGAFAEYDKTMLVAKMKAAKDRIRARDGKCEGRKEFETTVEGQAVLSEIKRLRRKKKGLSRRMSNAEIAEALNAKGFKSSLGKPFSSRIVFDLAKAVGTRKES